MSEVVARQRTRRLNGGRDVMVFRAVAHEELPAPDLLRRRAGQATPSGWGSYKQRVDG